MPEELNQDSDTTAVIEVKSIDNVYPGHPLGKDSTSIHLKDCELISELGSGGMGTVYLARQSKLNRLVAIKALKVNEEKQERSREWLRSEAVTMAALNHPNIVACYDIVQEDDRVFIVMEFVPGQMSVRDLVKRFGNLPEYIVTRILLDVIRGLQYMYGKGFIHRDLKPNNLLVYSEKANEWNSIDELFADPTTCIKICDFGIARSMKQATLPANSKVTLGSPNYMAPEQVFRLDQTDFRADIYSLAATAVFMLTGAPPFNFNERDKLFAYKVDHDIPNPLKLGAHITTRLALIITKMGRAAPEQRYQSYNNLFMDIEFSSYLLPGHHALANRHEARLLSFWRSMALITVFILLFGAACFISQYVQKTYFKERMISLSSSIGYWEGDRRNWNVSPLDTKDKTLVLTGRKADSRIVLIQQLLPGQCIDFMARHPGRGTVVFELADSEVKQGRLLWNRDSKGVNTFSFFMEGRQYPIEITNNSFGIDWLPCTIQLLKYGLMLKINGEEVCFVPIRNIKPCHFSVTMSSASLLMLKQVYLY